MNTDEAEEEFEGIEKPIINKELHHYLKLIYYEGHLDSFAYTFAKGSDSSTRETFYLYLRPDVFPAYLRHFKISLNIENFEEYYDFSFDFHGKERGDMKVYTKVFDVEVFLDFLEENLAFSFPENLSKICFNYSFVRRYDKFGKLKSYKFEFASNDGDIVREELKQLGFDIGHWPGMEEEVYAVDLDFSGKTNKVSVYYKNKLCDLASGGGVKLPQAVDFRQHHLDLTPTPTPDYSFARA